MKKENVKLFVICSDNRLLKKVLFSLRTKDFSIAGTTSVKKIRQALRAKIDVLIMDIHLSNPKAVEIAKAVRKANQDIVLVALVPQVISLPASSPFNVAIKFPIVPSVLQDRLRRALVQTRQDTRVLEAEIEIRHNRLQQNASHYDVLKVDSNASQDQITAAYDQISLMLHPDKLHHISSKETKAFALEIYVRACDAYSSLKNSSFRRSYDLALQKGMSHKEASSAQSQTFRPKTLDDLSTHSVAKRSLRKAQRALASRQFDMVLLHVKFALEMDPENELLREKWEDLKTKYS